VLCIGYHGCITSDRRKYAAALTLNSFWTIANDHETLSKTTGQAALGKAATRALEERLETQVCVIGGGSGGVGAALAAARGGADTVLIECESILGGTYTNAWVHTWEPTVAGDGIPREICERMREGYKGVPDHFFWLRRPPTDSRRLRLHRKGSLGMDEETGSCRSHCRRRLCRAVQAGLRFLQPRCFH